MTKAIVLVCRRARSSALMLLKEFVSGSEMSLVMIRAPQKPNVALKIRPERSAEKIGILVD